MFFFSDGAFRSTSDRDACVDHVLGFAWPDGVPSREARLLRSLSAGRAERAARVLGAVLLAERMGASAPYARIADRFGLGRTTYYRFRQAWAAERSLYSITAYEGRAPRPPSDGAAQRHVRLAARAALVADASASNGLIARRILGQSGGSVRLALNTVVKLVQSERRSLMLDPAALAKTYGRSLLGDFSALSNGVVVEGIISPLVGAFIVERGCGLILGYAAGTSADLSELYKRAAIKALAFLARERADLESGEASVVFGRARRKLASEDAETPNEKVDFTKVNAAQAGVRLVSLLGSRLGPLAFRPAHTQRKEWSARLAMPRGEGPFTLADADAVVGRAVERHNAPVLAVLRQEGFLGQGTAHGAMARAIEVAFG
jgi:hypothetical protein